MNQFVITVGKVGSEEQAEEIVAILGEVGTVGGWGFNPDKSGSVSAHVTTVLPFSAVQNHVFEKRGVTYAP